jgi:alpha-tubulin suppressor-like RCC1 family protein
LADGGTWPGRSGSRRRFGHVMWRPGLARHGRLRQQMLRQAAALALMAGACAAVQAPAPPLASAASSHATSIAAGNAQACMIRAGKAYCWGANGNGQLGNGSTINSSVPVPVYTGGVLSGKTLTQIVAGFSHTCALDAAGAAYCWGLNSSGQLGNNSVTQSLVPVAVTTSGVLAGKTLTQITAGNSHTCGLDASGTAYCWGSNGNGQLGINSTTRSLVPVAVTTSGVLAGKTLTQITAGYAHTCALDAAGLAYCWGANGNGQLGNGGTTSSLVPVAVTTSGVLSGKVLTQISADENGMYTCALDAAGAAYCWGAASFGQLGNGGVSSTPGVPVAVVTTGVLAGKTLTQIATGSGSTCAVASTGAAYCWGQGVNGELGNGSAANSSAPVAVTTSGVLSGKLLTQVSLGTNFACALDFSGAAYCWGLNTSGQVGNPATATRFLVPTAVTSQAAISAGYKHSCTISSGKAYCWGDNSDGELGNGSTTSSTVPVAVVASGVLAGVTLTQITAGFFFTCALSTTGAVYCWGFNADGELGNNSTTNSSVPVAVTTSGVLAGVTVTQITADSGFNACALGSNGAAYCWGKNSDGQLGNNTVTSSSVPVAVTTSGVLAGKTVTQITAGNDLTCALDSTGLAYCWGDDTRGQLGNNSNTTSPVPVAVTTTGVLSGVTLTQISAGNAFACALSGTGAAYCWGYNASGQLGNSSSVSSSVPVAVTTTGVLSGVTLTQVTPGASFTCALGAAGAAYCWGLNGSGQLGNNSTTSSAAPVAVTTSGVTLTQVSAGDTATCALGAAGVAYCWGSNSSGQLGNNSTTQSTVPVSVAPQGPTGVAAVAGDATAAISWTAPVFLNNGSVSGYTASAAPGGASCSTTGATGCAITGLTDGSTYTITVTVTATTGTAPSAPVTVEPVGFLSISVPSSATLPAAAPGTTDSARLGAATVTDNRALGSASWTATVTGTAFVTGSGTGPQTIPLTQISYWSGPATATSGNGTFTPGQPAAANAVNLTAGRVAFSLTAGSGVNSASWNPTLSVQVPAGAVAGTYTATITESVA